MAADSPMESDTEQTPLIERAQIKVKQTVVSITGVSGEEDDGVRKSKDERHQTDLGDFKHQPYQYYELFGEKDIHRLENELGGIEGVLQALKTDAKGGLSAEQSDREGDEFKTRQRVYGKNALPQKQMKSFLRFLWEALNDKVLWILIVASVVSFSLGLYQDFGPSHDPKEPRVNWIEGFAIMVAVLIVVSVSTLNDYSKERQFKKLNDRTDVRKVTVKRDNRYRSVESTELVVGDILHIEAGVILTCDAIFLRGHDVRCDESGATGESDAIPKCTYDEMLGNRDSGNENSKNNNADCFLLSGSKIVEGSCACLVVAVGQDSFQGRIFMDLRSSQPETTRMQKQLGELAEKIARIATIIGGVLLAVLLIRACIQLKTEPNRSTSVKVQSFIQAFVISVTLIVVAVPEGLPLAVTLALAFASQRMTQHDLLVRVLEACETMSNANVVVTDKTGTLTQNTMSVVALLVGGIEFEKQQETKDDGQQNSQASESLDQLDEYMPESFKNLFAEAIAVNSSAYEDKADDHAEPEFVGSKTESALLRLMNDFELGDYHKLRDDADILQMMPFSSSRKAMGVLINTGDGARFHAKGAAETLIDKCTKQLEFAESKEGTSTSKLADEQRKKIAEAIEQYAQKSLRTLALCYRETDSNSEKPSYEEMAEDLTLIALVGIQDPLRANAAQSVADCHKAGVATIMCTGDGLLTASAIAKECGILEDGGKTIEGTAWRRLSRQDKAELVPNLRVLARSLPEDKEDLVKILQEEVGKIVCCTGDGSNGLSFHPKIVVLLRKTDAMAIKRADIGFAMGQTGTEVAKEAADVLLMTDNFGSIVDAIVWGRCVSGEYQLPQRKSVDKADAVRKFLQFQLAVNCTAIIITFVSSTVAGDENSVLNAVQLLWVNLIMDTFAALALATDSADRKLLNRQPENRKAPIINATMTKQIIAQAFFQTFVTLLLHFGGQKIIRPFIGNQEISAIEFNTTVFNVFVFCQIFNLLNCRKIDNKLNIFENAFSNFWLLGILAIMVTGQILIVFVGGQAFHVAPISARLWALSVSIGFLSIPIGAFARFIPDTPLQNLMIRLGLTDDPNSLPMERENADDQPKGKLEHTRQLIKNIFGAGRHKANTIDYWHQRDD